MRPRGTRTRRLWKGGRVLLDRVQVQPLAATRSAGKVGPPRVFGPRLGLRTHPRALDAAHGQYGASLEDLLSLRGGVSVHVASMACSVVVVYETLDSASLALTSKAPLA